MTAFEPTKDLLQVLRRSDVWVPSDPIAFTDPLAFDKGIFRREPVDTQDERETNTNVTEKSVMSLNSETKTNKHRRKGHRLRRLPCNCMSSAFSLSSFYSLVLVL